jgi:fengycin family lipopeptide synthetase D
MEHDTCHSFENRLGNTIKQAEKRLFYPLSPAQERLYALQRRDPGSTHYNIPFVVALEGELNVGRIDMAFRSLVQRHESFRTSFQVMDKTPIQRIHPEVPFVMEYYDITVEWGATVQLIVKNFIRPFNLSRAPLLRVGIIKTGNNRHVLMTDMHHIVADESSSGIFTREFMRVYNGKKLPPLRLHYKDFTWWQIQRRAQGALRKQQTFWLDRFGDIPPPDLPTDYDRPPSHDFCGSCFSFAVEDRLLPGIKEILLRTGAALHSFLLAIFTLLLSRYARGEDIVIGCPVPVRTRTVLKPLIGMLVNILPMRNKPNSQETFCQFLEKVEENALEAYKNQDYPFEELVNLLGLKEEEGRNPLFDAAFTLHTADIEQCGAYAGAKALTVRPVEFERKSSVYDITLRAYKTSGFPAGGLIMKLEYKTALFKSRTMEKYAAHYIEILEQVLADNDILLRNIRCSQGSAALETGLCAGDE